MFSGLEILVFGALAFLFITGKNDRKALALRLEQVERELRSLRGWVQRQVAHARSHENVLALLTSSTDPVRIRVRGGQERTGYARGVEDEQLLLESLPTPYDDPHDAASRTERIPIVRIVGYLDEANHWQAMPAAPHALSEPDD